MNQEEERDYLRPVTSADVWASWIVGLAVTFFLGLLLVI